MPLLDICSFIRDKENLTLWRPCSLELLLDCSQTLFAKMTGTSLNIRENVKYTRFGAYAKDYNQHSNDKEPCYMEALEDIYVYSVQGCIPEDNLPTLECWPRDVMNESSDGSDSEETDAPLNQGFQIDIPDLIYSLWIFECEDGNIMSTEQVCHGDCRYCERFSSCDENIYKNLCLELVRIGNGLQPHNTFLGSLAEDVFQYLCENYIYTSSASDSGLYSQSIVSWMSIKQLFALGYLSSGEESGTTIAVAHPHGGAVLQWLSDYHDEPERYHLLKREENCLQAADIIIQMLLTLFERLNDNTCCKYLLCPLSKPGTEKPYDGVMPILQFAGVISGNAISINLFYNEIYLYDGEKEFEKNNRGSKLISMSLYIFLQTLDFLYQKFGEKYLKKKDDEEKVA